MSNYSALIDEVKYDPESGNLYAAKDKGTRWKKGRKIGNINLHGYVVFNVNGRHFLAHRVAFFLYHGRMPRGKVDHINRIRHDNRIANLREVDESQNCQNQSLRSDNTSGKKGVTWCKLRGKWQGQIQHKGKRFSAYFNSIEDAAAWYDSKAKQLFEQFSSNNKELGNE